MKTKIIKFTGRPKNKKNKIIDVVETKIFSNKNRKQTFKPK